MENTVKISCIINATDPTVPLGMEIWLDDQQIFNLDWIKESHKISHNISDLEADHELRFVMKNKNSEHTIVDDIGNIVKDARLTISDLSFDEINLGHIVTEKAVYTHDFNGAGDTVKDKFFGEIGCNGVVNLKFTTPAYIWLLENM